MKRKGLILILVCILTALGMFTSCSEQNDIAEQKGSKTAENTLTVTESEQEQSKATGETEDILPEDRILEQMTLREKVGQLFFIRPDSLDVTQSKEQVIDPYAEGVTALTAEMSAMLKKYPAGGIVIFSKNIESPQQLGDFNAELLNAVDVPMFIAVDEEGGAVARLANHPAFNVTTYESAAAVAVSGDVSQALEMGNVIGAYLKEYGFNMDFAPVADVNTNIDNPVIGERAFSSDAKTAAQMAEAMADGLKAQNIIPVFKHFPGHGDTAQDSHNGIAVSYKTREEMEACEWLPFETAGEEDCIMVGHIAVPEITGDMVPSSLCETVVTEILRNKLDFEGLIITDSMEMGAVTESYSGAEGAVMAIIAGCDIVLGPDGFTEAFDAVMKAVEEGVISEKRIDESVRRILRFKLKYSIIE